MITVEIVDPDLNNTSRALCNLISEWSRETKDVEKGTAEQRHRALEAWMKGKYGYDTAVTKTGNDLFVHIDANESFFILKHG